MGGCLSLLISLSQVLNRVGSYFCRRDYYIFNFNKNLVALEKAMKDLKAMLDDVKGKLHREEGGLQRLQRVKVWLRRVETIESQYNELNRAITVEFQRLSRFRVCLESLKSRIRCGRRVFLMLKEVATLKSNGLLFKVVAEPAARSHDVCAKMENTCLEPEVAWGLFQTKVGQSTLESHPGIAELARLVAGKCRGLPLALNAMGETMSCKRTVQEWQHAVNVLSSSSSGTGLSGMEDKILRVLKYAFDNLSGDQVKSCFLYCSLFPEGYLISKESLIEYWICEGFITDKNKNREKEFNQGYEIIATFVRACLLLEEGSNKSKVKMHGMVREMALWISSDLGRNREKCIVRAGVGLCEVPKVQNWCDVKRMSLMGNEMVQISGSSHCDGLTTLLLQGNKKLVNISGEFFRFMPNLLVLDLSSNRGLTQLPEQILKLVSLQYLDLSDTNIVQLPCGLRKLKNLMHLNLESTWKLESVSGFSKLWSLRTVKLRGSKALIDLRLVKELEGLDNLEVLTIDVSSSMVAKKLLSSSQRLVECIKEVHIKYLKEGMTLPTMVSLQSLNIECGVTDIKIEETTSSFWHRSPTTSYIPNLSSVFIIHCNNLKDLTWLLFAPNLTFLEVGFSKHMEDIISEEKALSCVIIPFQKLKSITLYNLPMLKSIYSRPLPLPCLRKVSVSGCPKLRKLPLDASSVVKVEELVIHWIPLSLYSPLLCDLQIQGNSIRLISLPLDPCSGAAGEETVINYKDKEWMEGFEWEDEATRLRFINSCKLGV